VAAGSAAERAGLNPGDVVRTLDGVRTASFADVQFALHRARGAALPIAWDRGADRCEGVLRPQAGWRRTDLSWRASTRRLGPAPSIHGDDLGIEERRRLGLSADRLAMVLGPFQPQAARQAGLRQGDVIVGADDRQLSMTAAQFDVHVRLNYEAGRKITYNLLRDGRPLKITLTLPSSPP
jgi:S1-C subfamily serine protease